METKILRRSVLALSLSSMLASIALSQVRRVTDQPRLPESSTALKGEQADATDALVGPRVTVSKTAYADGEEVCGVIRISNSGDQPATVSHIMDTLEVHFPRNSPTPSLPAGSTTNWFKVADVPILLPGPIAPGATETIPYCFSLCLVADYTGANSMRNVVTVRAINQAGIERSFTTRSVSFPPPVLDCQACCLPNGDCTDTVPNSCTAEGGESQGAGTDCTSTQCCLPLGTTGCASIDCCDANATCSDNTCCIRLADMGCTERSDCCEEDGTAICDDTGKCCAPNRAPRSCSHPTDCCDPIATCGSEGTCCIPLGVTGCTDLVGNDCCDTFGAVICEAGKCCAPTGTEDSCNFDTDCCDPDATCNGGTCCVRLAETGCDDASDCCEGDGFVICDAGRCCAPNKAPDSCHDAADCCDGNATCGTNGTCCIALGEVGCTNLVGSDCCESSFGAVICEAGKCCAPTGASDSCNIDTDCCDLGATCNGGTCCVETGNVGCEDVSDCCNDRSGMACLAEKCCVQTDVDFHSACNDDTDCCQLSATCDIHGACCIATGTAGCATDSHCCHSSATCQSGTGRCCAPNAAGGACQDSSDCCDGNAICNLNSTCCVPDLRPCAQPSDCCSGFCSGGLCEGVISP